MSDLVEYVRFGYLFATDREQLTDQREEFRDHGRCAVSGFLSFFEIVADRIVYIASPKRQIGVTQNYGYDIVEVVGDSIGTN